MESINIMNENIPTKIINNSKKRLPWIDRNIKAIIRKRNKLFKRMKQHPNSKTTQHFKDIKHQIQRETRKAYWNYLENIICYDENIETAQKQKKFWNYIKNTKKDNSGVAPLRHEGILVDNTKQKAAILNKQYRSVFTPENDNEQIPQLPYIGNFSRRRKWHLEDVLNFHWVIFSLFQGLSVKTYSRVNISLCLFLAITGRSRTQRKLNSREKFPIYGTW